MESSSGARTIRHNLIEHNHQKKTIQYNQSTNAKVFNNIRYSESSILLKP